MLCFYFNDLYCYICLSSSGCRKPPSISKGKYVSNGKDVVNDTASLKCKSRYRISSAALDDAQIECQEDGNWSSKDVTCEKGTHINQDFFHYFTVQTCLHMLNAAQLLKTD